MLRKLGTSIQSLGRFCSLKTAREATQCPQSPPCLRDYEYSSLIQSSLKQWQPVRAFGLVVQSHLHNVALDIHTYSQVAEGLRQSQSDSSYVEVLYKLYRAHFSPSILMLTHMDYLRGRVNANIKAQLEDDYRRLGYDSLPDAQRGSFDAQQSVKAGSQSNEVPQSVTKAPQGEAEDSGVGMALNEALANAESIVLHDVVLNLKNLRQNDIPTTQQSTGDWLEVHQRDEAKRFNFRQKAVQHSEQVEFEMDLFRGFSIGKIQINRRKT